MKRKLLMIALAILIVVCGTGCKMGGCNETPPSGSWSFDINPLSFAVFAVVAVPVMAVDELCQDVSQYCEDRFYDYPGTWESRSLNWRTIYSEAVVGNLERWEHFCDDT